MVRFGARDYVEEEMRYERRVREKERCRDYDEEKQRCERRIKEKERKLRDVEREDTRYAKEKIHRKYEKHGKEKEMGDI
jgi:hypothetical protein